MKTSALLERYKSLASEAAAARRRADRLDAKLAAAERALGERLARLEGRVLHLWDGLPSGSGDYLVLEAGRLAPYQAPPWVHERDLDALCPPPLDEAAAEFAELSAASEADRAVASLSPLSL